MDECKDVIWTKNGRGEERAYRLMDADEVHGTYLKKDSNIFDTVIEDRICSLAKSSENLNCDTYIEYFRVEPMIAKLGNRLPFKTQLHELAAMFHYKNIYEKIKFINDLETFQKIKERYPTRSKVLLGIDSQIEELTEKIMTTLTTEQNAEIRFVLELQLEIMQGL